MIILDTNVISEAMRGPKADPQVLDWLRSLPRQPVTTVINRAEIMAGIALLPTGNRRDKLRTAAESAFNTLGSCLPLVPACADEYGDIVAVRQAAGRQIGGMDALIASIARVSGSSLATRNVHDFSGLGIDVIDPWSDWPDA